MSGEVLSQVAQASAKQASTTSESDGTQGDIIIDVRFHPNGLVNSANHRPAKISPQDWFDLLCRAAPGTYQPLAGGRGSFRIRREEFDRIVQEHAK
jgi:hypothetical protein